MISFLIALSDKGRVVFFVGVHVFEQTSDERKKLIRDVVRFL